MCCDGSGSAAAAAAAAAAAEAVGLSLTLTTLVVRKLSAYFYRHRRRVISYARLDGDVVHQNHA